MRKKGGFTLGRFQPFHNEHVNLIEEIKKDCDAVYVGILHTELSEENPFTYKERRDMILKYDDSLEVFEYEKKDMMVLGIGIRKEVPYDAVYYTGNLRERLGMASLGFQTKMKKRKDDYSATNIRKMVFSGNKKWEKMIPESTKKILNKIKTKRIKKIKELEKKNRLLGKYDI